VSRDVIQASRCFTRRGRIGWRRPVRIGTGR